MSIDTQAISDQHRSQASAAHEPEHITSLGWKILASLVLGAVTALVLVLYVFAGGTEAVITGSILLGFGVGWALLATLTIRRTGAPQAWAVIPAVAMGATGIALLALRPGNDTMAALNWVWPPVTLAMALRTFVEMRRSLPSRGRWLLTPVIAVPALAAVGATYGNIALPGDVDTHGAPGVLWNVNGHLLHLECHGKGGPTVVLFNGLGEVSASWPRITDRVTETTRVCAYDRAGQGWSEDAASPQDGVEAAEDLHALLASAGERGPYVLVGHSTGGAYALTYAARYRNEVAGLVLLDSSSPEAFTRVQAYRHQYALARRASALLPTVRRLGLGQLVAPNSHLQDQEADTVIALTSTARAASNQRDELTVIPEVFSQAQALTTLDDRPLAVLTASQSSLNTDGWRDAQEQLAQLSRNRLHRTVESTPSGLLEDPRPAAESVRAITQVISAVRNGTPLSAG